MPWIVIYCIILSIYQKISINLRFRGLLDKMMNKGVYFDDLLSQLYIVFIRIRFPNTERKLLSFNKKIDNKMDSFNIVNRFIYISLSNKRLFQFIISSKYYPSFQCLKSNYSSLLNKTHINLSTDVLAMLIIACFCPYQLKKKPLWLVGRGQQLTLPPILLALDAEYLLQ